MRAIRGQGPLLRGEFREQVRAYEKSLLLADELPSLPLNLVSKAAV